MIQIIPKTNIDFIGKRYIFFTISAVLLLSGIASLIMKKGPRWGLDFTGGSLVEVKFETAPSIDQVRSALSQAGIPSFEIQSVSGQGVIVRAQLSPGEGKTETKANTGFTVQSVLEQSFAENKPVILRKEFVGPTVGRHLFKQTGLAFIFTFVGIIIYVGFRFHAPLWGAAGVIAIIHDVLATIGIFSILDKEITVTVVAALLTIAGYSINDTIVIFDFMREKFRLLRTEPMEKIINLSLNETLSRTLITNLTVLLVVLTLFFFGGEVIHDFAFAMVFGAIVGTYSTIGIAAAFIFEYTRIKAIRK